MFSRPKSHNPSKRTHRTQKTPKRDSLAWARANILPPMGKKISDSGISSIDCGEPASFPRISFNPPLDKLQGTFARFARFLPDPEKNQANTRKTNAKQRLNPSKSGIIPSRAGVLKNEA
jgi:hypothetical protein